MPDDLAGRLLRAGLVTRDQLAAALSTAPLHGGVLVRELVARGVSEDALAGFFLSEGFGPVMDRADLEKADAAALERLPGRLAADLLALPVRASPAGLVVAMAAPSDRHTMKEVERAAGGDVLPMVARLGDLIAALRAAHPGVSVEGARRGVEEELSSARSSLPLESYPPESEPPVLMLVRRRERPSDPDDVNASNEESETPLDEDDAPLPLVRTKAHGGPSPKTEQAASTPERRVVARTFSKPVRRSLPPPSAPTDVEKHRGSTAEYAIPPSEAPALSVTADAAQPARPDIAASAPEERPESIIAPSSEPPGRVSLPGDATRIEGSSPPANPSLIPPEHARWDAAGDAPSPEPVEPAPDRRRSLRPRASARPPSSAPTSQDKAPQSASLGAAEVDKPADIGSVLSNMRGARERDDVVRLACEGALTVARTSVFLALRKGVLKGWDGRGGGLSRDAVRNLWLPTTSASTFSKVVRDQAPYVGPYGPSVADGVFRAAVSSRGGSLAVYPISVSDRVVGVLCADGLSDDTLGAERVETLAHAVAEAFKRIIVGSK